VSVAATGAVTRQTGRLCESLHTAFALREDIEPVRAAEGASYERKLFKRQSMPHS
jgi:hypothetical protein